MKTKYFYNAFNILYDLVKESLGIFQKEELYRQLFQAIYVMSGDALYDNDSIRKITSGNQTIHLRAVKKLHTPEGVYNQPIKMVTIYFQDGSIRNETPLTEANIES